jgi:AraC-like DNA-binding protein
VKPLQIAFPRSQPRSAFPVDDFPGYVREAIAMLLRGGRADIRLMAEVTGMGPRTLQRRLARAGVSYTRLVAQARLDLAVRLLEDPRVKLIDVALELGYSDPAHFTRAFQRWTGAAPRAFRRHRFQEPGAPHAAASP